MIVNIIEAINSVNNGEGTKTNISKKLNIAVSIFEKKAKEEGYVWNKEAKKFVSEDFKDENEIGKENDFNNKINNEINKKNNEENNEGIKMNIENKTENDIENNDENNVENNLSMTALLDSIGAKEKQFKPVTVHLRSDIADTLDSLVKGKGKGAKQELINGMLEMVLKANKYL